MKCYFYSIVFFLAAIQFTYAQQDNRFYDPNTGCWRVTGNYSGNTYPQDLVFNWQSIQTPVAYQLMRVFFADSLHGWICHTGTGGMRSTDSGFNWTTFSFYDSTFTTAYQGEYFLNQSTGWMVGGALQIRKTTDGGATWFKQYPPPVSGIYHSICFFDNNTGFAVGSKGGNPDPFISKTTNSGISWIELPDTYSGAHELNDMYWFNSTTGWIAGYNILLYTTNNGQNFINLFSNIPPTSNGANELFTIWFANSQTGWIGGGNLDKKNIYITTNGGGNWTFQDNPVSQNNYYVQINDIAFMTPDSGWAIHGTPSTGAIMSTTNGGLNWVIEQGASNWYQSIFVYNRSKAWVASSGGTVWYSNLSTLSGITNESQIANKFELSQNYPNPFNPKTEIKYSIPEYSKVKLTIYNVTGNEIATLVNREQLKGTYSVKFDGSNFASGIYFYTIIAGDYRNTKKMILIK